MKSTNIVLSAPQVYHYFAGQAVMPVDDVRDLGVIIDSKLTMQSHVQSVARSCFYQLRQLRSVQRSLTANA